MITDGTVLDRRYRIDELIGRGGTADVYRGTDELLGREVAVKVFDSRHTDLNSADRQRSEMRALSSLDHPHLVTVYDARVRAGDTDHTYLVMELVYGATLADRLARGPLPMREVTRIGIALAEALAAVHAANLVHRDIKPANVLMTETGGVKLADFGLARQLDAGSRVTTGPDAMGTAAYFSPEQACAEEVGPPGDVYALGLVLLECLTGRPEFPGGALQSAVARLLRDPVIPPVLAEPWPALLASMTARMPDRRPSADQVGAVLRGGPGARIPEPAVAGPAELPLVPALPGLSVQSVLPVAPAVPEVPVIRVNPRPVGEVDLTLPFSRVSPATGRGRRRAPWVVLAGAVAAIGLTLAAALGADDPGTSPLTPAAPAPATATTPGTTGRLTLPSTVPGTPPAGTSGEQPPTDPQTPTPEVPTPPAAQVVPAAQESSTIQDGAAQDAAASQDVVANQNGAADQGSAVARDGSASSPVAPAQPVAPAPAAPPAQPAAPPAPAPEPEPAPAAPPASGGGGGNGDPGGSPGNSGAGGQGPGGGAGQGNGDGGGNADAGGNGAGGNGNGTGNGTGNGQGKADPPGKPKG